MSIKSGQRYKITNEENGLVFDLCGQRYSITNEESGLVFERSGGRNKSVIGQNFHGLDNQQASGHPYFDSLFLAQPQYTSVDRRAAGRWPMDYSIS
jgi:hypothetical protein